MTRAPLAGAPVRSITATMVPFSLFVALCCLLTAPLSAQNLLPNPGFESVSTCPTSLSQLSGYVTSWTPANSASPDYSNCGFNGNVAINSGPNSGTGSISMWASTNLISCLPLAYSELIRANLTSAMVAGQTYRVTMALRGDSVGFASNAPNNCVDLGMYFFEAGNPPATNGNCCLNVTPQWAIPGGMVSPGTYTTFSGTFVAGGNYDQVIIGPFCNANTATSTCDNTTPTSVYYNLDDVAAELIIPLTAAELSLRGLAFAQFNRLRGELPAELSFTRVMLQRSPDGQTFAELHRTVPGSASSAFEFVDQDPFPAENIYRLTGIDADGQVHRSNTVLLRGPETHPRTDPELKIGVNPQTKRLSVSLLADQSGSGAVQILDGTGRRVRRAGIRLNAGFTEFTLALDGLPPGAYLLRVHAVATGKTWRGKFIFVD
ncbi:MAG: hypothetical protein AAF998_11815 [Bacteroidota bacterium]